MPLVLQGSGGDGTGVSGGATSSAISGSITSGSRRIGGEDDASSSVRSGTSDGIVSVGVLDGRVGEVVVAMLTSCFFARDKDNDNDNGSLPRRGGGGGDRGSADDDDGDGVVGCVGRDGDDEGGNKDDGGSDALPPPPLATAAVGIYSWDSLRKHLLPPLRIFAPALWERFIQGVVTQLKDSLTLTPPSSSTQQVPQPSSSSSSPPLSSALTQPLSLSFQPRKWARHLCGLLTTVTVPIAEMVPLVRAGRDIDERVERAGMIKAVGLTSAGEATNNQTTRINYFRSINCALTPSR